MYASRVNGAPPDQAGTSCSPLVFDSLGFIEAGNAGELALNEVQELREVYPGDGLLHDFAFEESVGGGCFFHVIQSGRAEGQPSREASGSLQVSDQHSPRGRSNEHPDRAVWTEGSVCHRIDGEYRGAEIAANDKVVVSLSTACDVSRSMHDAANQVNEPSVDQLLRLTIEIPTNDPRTSQGAEPSRHMIKDVDIGGVRRANAVL